MHRPQALGAVAGQSADILTRLRARAPRVHCITNSVAQNFTANALLAVGALPSMTISSNEIGHFVVGADALLVNLGTFDAERAEAIEIALREATKAGKPWVLDPVLIDRSPPRAKLAHGLLGKAPSAVRLNAAELSTLANNQDIEVFAAAAKTVVALSGQHDRVTDGSRLAEITNGHVLMAKVTAMGCAVSALLAACLAVENDAWQASVAAMVIAGVAGEAAGAKAEGPGSFAVAFLDALHRLDADILQQKARVMT